MPSTDYVPVIHDTGHRKRVSNVFAGIVGTFHPFSPLAAALVAPTQLWVTIAAKLNYDIVKLNTPKQADGKTK